MEHNGNQVLRLHRTNVAKQFFFSPSLLPLDSCQVIDEVRSPSTQWIRKLTFLSNAASIVCVVDCTVLPLLTLLVSLLGLAEQPHHWQYLHLLGHWVAIYFVLPVGSFTVLVNYLNYKRLSLTILAVFGLLLIGMANYPHEQNLAEGALQHRLLHTGLTHRLTNVLGCSFLMVSNYQLRQIGQCPNKNCKHVSNDKQSRS